MQIENLEQEVSKIRTLLRTTLQDQAFVEREQKSKAQSQRSNALSQKTARESYKPLQAQLSIASIEENLQKADQIQLTADKVMQETERRPPVSNLHTKCQ